MSSALDHHVTSAPRGTDSRLGSDPDAVRHSRFLLATWDGGGHAGPMLSVARGLLARGHTVRVLADPVLRAEVEASGAGFVSWRLAPHRAPGAEAGGTVMGDGESHGPRAAAMRVRDALMCGPAGSFADDCLAELRRHPADVVAADHLLLGALVAGEAAGARTAALATTLLGVPQWGVPPAGSGLGSARGPAARARRAVMARLVTRFWAGGLPALNTARARHGLEPFRDPVDLVAHWDRVLVLSSAALELPGWAPPPHVRLVGARLDDPVWAAPWQPPAGDAPLILVALSSTDMHQRDVLARAADALGRLPVQGLVTTGPAIDPGDVPAPPNVRVVRSAPHTQVLRHAAAVVTHAGHGTVAKALAAGVPLVALPLGRDQFDIAARVVEAGTGVRLPSSAPSDRIAKAVRRVLDDPSYAAAARRAARTMAAEAGEDRAVLELEQLARQLRTP